MRSASLSNRSAGRDVATLFTDGESSFQNAKLGRASLVVYKVVADCLAKGSLFVLTVVAAHRLTPHAFGVFGLGTTVGWMLSVIADFGIQLHLARAVSRSPDAAGALLRHWWRIRVASSIAGLGLLTASLALFHVDSATAVPLVVFAAAYACTSLVEFLNYFYRGLSRSDIESTLTLTQRAATLIAGLAVLTWWPEVTLLAGAMLAPALIVLGWSAGFAMALQAPATMDIRAGRFVADVFPIGAGIVLSAVYFRIDVLLVQMWAGTDAVAGYNAVFRPIDAIRLFPAAVLAVALPSLCRADSLNPLRRVAAGLTAFGAAVAAVLFITAQRLIPLLFGPLYIHTVPAFRVLALALPLLCLNFAMTHQLIGWNRQRAYAAICAVALGVNVALNAWLIPVWSIEGAAWATLGTEVCVSAGCATALWIRT